LSPTLARDAVWLSALLPFEQAAQVLARIGGYDVPATTLWEHSQQVGEDWAAQAEARHVSVERTRWQTQHYQPQARRSVSMDGGMVHLQHEGWKELKVGVVGRLRPPWEIAATDTLRSHDLHYTAVLGNPDDFATALWQLAVDQRVPYAGQVAVTADGAAWIWRLTADLFPCSTQIIDWYHAMQHLKSLAQARFPDESQQAQTWLNTLKQQLWAGECWQVIEQARAAGLTAQVAYFEQHQYRMDYPVFRAEGLPVGSGTTESTVKQFKHRFCGAGMRWSRQGVRRMIPLRCAVMEGTFDQRWQAA
jgi:hypothetical protein